MMGRYGKSYDYYDDEIGYDKGWKYDLGKDDPHIPNKDEAKLLRRLMAENNMTEEEVRSIKKYRKLLSEESKKGEKSKGGLWKNVSIQKYWKSITKLTGFPREHPVSKFVYNKNRNDFQNTWFRINYPPMNLSKHDLEVLENYDLTKY